MPKFRQVVTDGTSIYGATDSGALLWYRQGKFHADGSSDWFPNSGNPIGTGWMFSKLFADLGSQGILYGVTQDGELLWYQDTLQDGTNRSDGRSGWDKHSGTVIADKWNQYSQICAGPNGVIYAVDESANLTWHRYLGQRLVTTGLNQKPHYEAVWDPRSGSKIGVGWNRFQTIFCSPFPGNFPGRFPMIIYAIENGVDGGNLLWYMDTKGDGTNASNGTSGWDPRSGSQIGVGWSTTAFSPGGGIIYMISSPGGELRWYADLRHDGSNPPDGSSGWDLQSGTVIGTEWYMD